MANKKKGAKKKFVDNSLKDTNKKSPNKLFEFYSKHPTLIRILDKINDISNKFMIGYLVFMGVLIAVPIVIAYYSLPEAIRGQISALLGTALSVIIIPIVLNAYNRKRDVENKRFETNKDLYFEFTKLLLPVLLEGTCKNEDTERIKEYILGNYNIMCVSFSANLFSNICSLYNGCACNNYKNIEYYGEKIIKEIRRECGNGKSFILSNLVIKLNRENEVD